jgi:hypothetical protein
MNVGELAQRLYEEGCSSANYAIGNRGMGDLFYLARREAKWQVCYTERGSDSPPIYVSEDEPDACEFFFQHVMSKPHHHCVGFFKSKQNAENLKATLAAMDLPSWSDRIPSGGPSDPRFRVFVTGKTIFPAKAALGVIPIRDEGA